MFGWGRQREQVTLTGMAGEASLKRGHLNTDMHTESTPCEDEGGDWEEAWISQETLEIAGKPAKLGQKRGKDLPL